MPNACVAFTFHPLQACVFASECVHKCVSCVCGMCVCVRVCFWPQYDCCWWCRLLTKCPSGMQHCCFHAAFKCGGIFISFLLLLSLSPCLSLSPSLSSATCLSFLLFAFVVCRFLLSVFVFWVFKACLACAAGIVLVLDVSLGIISTDCVSFHFWLLFQLLLLLLLLSFVVATVVVLAFASAVIWYAFCRAFARPRVHPRWAASLYDSPACLPPSLSLCLSDCLSMRLFFPLIPLSRPSLSVCARKKTICAFNLNYKLYSSATKFNQIVGV